MQKISAMYLLGLAWKRIWALFGVAILMITAAICYCKFVATPIYTAKASIIVTNGGSVTSNEIADDKWVSNSDIVASINLIETVVDVLETNDIYKQLADTLDGDYTYGELKSRASISPRGEQTMFIDVSFSADTPEEATLLVNSFVELAPGYISEPISYSSSKYYLAENASKTYPVTGRFAMIAAVLGIIVTYGIFLLIDIFDRAIKGENDFVSRFDIPLLGVVPDFECVPSSSYSHKGGK